MPDGWIKLHRQIIDSPVFAHPTALKIWVWCLCRASHKDSHVLLDVGGSFTTVFVKRGQFLFGRHKAEESLGIDGSTIYKWMQKFEGTMDMIKIESNNKYSIVTILNFNEFQSQENVEVAAEEQQRNNSVTTEEQQRNTYKNAKNVKNDKNISERANDFYSDLTPFVGTYGKDLIRQFYDYWTEKNKTGTKLRFESQKFFDLSKRLKTWDRRSKETYQKPVSQKTNYKYQ